MDTLSTLIFSAIVSISPPEKVAKYTGKETVEQMTERYKGISKDIAYVVENSDPLFIGDSAKTETAMLLVSIAYFESSFHKGVESGYIRGDNGNSWCFMQINIGKGKVIVGDDNMKTWTGKDLIQDRKKCFQAGLEILRLSIKECKWLKGGDRLSVYTSGKCQSGERKAHLRWNFARKLMTDFIRKERKNSTST